MRTLRLHDTGPDVSELQRMLTAAGFPCEPDADFGPKTLDAVKAFQAAHGLDPDGVAGSRTVAALEALAPTDPPPGVSWPWITLAGVVATTLTTGGILLLRHLRSR